MHPVVNTLLTLCHFGLKPHTDQMKEQERKAAIASPALTLAVSEILLLFHCLKRVKAAAHFFQ